MANIELLSQETIDKIAAGEVIDRPSSVVKELVENSMDAKASAITVEIKDGGLSLVRVTDNGCGIQKSQVPLAFLRHSTSKIKSVEDLLSVSSLGFRGEALSSIAAVAQAELITKEPFALTGTRYVIEGSVEKENEEVGAPDGTTFLVRNLFYNTPARRKFLKTAQTEAGYVHGLIERLALSRPDISFKLIINGQPKLYTSGNSGVKDVIFQIYGREIAASLIAVDEENELFRVSGYLGKPVISRGNRNFENYFINQRYIKSSLISKSLEDAYKSFLMQRQYPFCALYFSFDGEMLDVNVHPSKMELRFLQKEGIYQALFSCVREKLMQKDHIRSVPLGAKDAQKEKPVKTARDGLPEPFEKKRLAQAAAYVGKDSPYEPKYPEFSRNTAGERTDMQESDAKPGQEHAQDADIAGRQERLAQEAGQAGRQQDADIAGRPERLAQEAGQAGRQQDADIAGRPERLAQEAGRREDMPAEAAGSFGYPAAGAEKTDGPQDAAGKKEAPYDDAAQRSYVQEELAFDKGFLSGQARARHKIIGQVFGTYWLAEYDDKLFIIDQHAAHEKALYERTVRSLEKKECATQMVSPPIILALGHREEQALIACEKQLARLGFQISHFGGREYAVCGVPADLFGLDARQILLEVLDGFDEIPKSAAPELVMEKIASMSCKAAVKGNHALSRPEIEALIDELLELENPYFCPHGRPTIISMDKQELEKKFKRIV